jgi:uncharacterized membrane protein YeiH
VVLHSGLYAVPAVVGAAVVVAADELDIHVVAIPILGAAVCFAIRILGVQLGVNLPRAPGSDPPPAGG